LTPPDPRATAPLQRLSREKVQAVIVPGNGLLNSEQKRIAELARALRLPLVFSAREGVDAGGLASYGVSISENYRRAATYIDKILKGAAPGDLPIEFPTKVELVINLKTAKALGITVPPTLLARADEVIE
jgi:putative tryptophan/tyrosine transport system substrate-binding protein